AGLGRAERTGGGGRRRLPEDPRPDRGAVPAPLRAPHPVLQDRRRLPRLAQRAPAGVADGRRTALGPQPAAPGPGPGARRRLRGPDRPRTRRGAVARTAARARRPGGRNRRRGRAAMSIERFSLNQATVKRADLATVLDLAAAAGVPAVGLWRDRVAEIGLEEAASRLAGSGLRFSSLCRGGFLTDPGAAGEAWAENLRAIEEAAALAAAGAPGSAPVLVLVVGGLPPGDRDLRGARDRVRRMLHRLAPEARARGVRLALEPMHPVFCADRAVVSTLAQALDLVADLDPEVAGVAVDTYHVWWDPQVLPAIARAGEEGRIACYQVCDWITPVPEGA